MLLRSVSIGLCALVICGCKPADKPTPPVESPPTVSNSEKEEVKPDAPQSPAPKAAVATPKPSTDPVPIPLIEVASLEPAVQAQLSKAIYAAKAAPDSAEKVGALAMLLDAYNIREPAAQLYQGAARLDPKSFEWAYLGGRLLLFANQVDPAIELLTRAVSLKPDDVPAQVVLVSGLIQADRLKEAGEWAVKLHEKNPDHALANYLLGVINLKQEAPIFALQFLKPVHEAFPEMGRVREDLAATFEMLGQTEKAAKLREVKNTNNRIPVMADPHLEAVLNLATGTAAENKRGVAALMEGNAKDAKTHFAKALAFSPTDTSARVGLADAHLRLGEFEESEKLIAPLVDDENDSLTGLVLMAQLRIAQKQFDDAESLIERAEKLGAEPIRILKLRLKMATGRNDLSTIVTLLESIVELEPNRPGRYYDLGNAYVFSKRIEDAEKAFSKTVELSPRHAGAMQGLAAIYNAKGETDAAHTWYQRAFIAGGTAPQTLLVAGRDALDKKEFARAESILKQAFAAYPKDADIGDMLSRIYSMCPDPKFRDWEKAILIAQSLYGDDEKTIPLRGFHTLAAAHAEADNFQEASRLVQIGVEKASAVNDQDNIVRFNLAKQQYDHHKHLYDPQVPFEYD